MSGLKLKNRNRTRRGRGSRPSARKTARRGGGNSRSGRNNRKRRVSFDLSGLTWRPRRLAIVGSAVVLVAGMIVVMSNAPGWGRGEGRFTLDRLEVRGSAVLTQDEVLSLSGLELGGNLLDVRISDLEESLTTSPRIERAQALRVLPDRVLVTLNEKRPVALVVAGDEITTEASVKDISERAGNGFYVFETRSTNQDGDTVCVGTWTNIVRGG